MSYLKFSFNLLSYKRRNKLILCIPNFLYISIKFTYWYYFYPFSHFSSEHKFTINYMRKNVRFLSYLFSININLSGTIYIYTLITHIYILFKYTFVRINVRIYVYYDTLSHIIVLYALNVFLKELKELCMYVYMYVMLYFVMKYKSKEFLLLRDGPHKFTFSLEKKKWHKTDLIVSFCYFLNVCVVHASVVWSILLLYAQYSLVCANNIPSNRHNIIIFFL